MTALGLVNTLRARTRTVDPAALKGDDYGWGTYKVSTGGHTVPLQSSTYYCTTVLLLLIYRTYPKSVL